MLALALLLGLRCPPLGSNAGGGTAFSSFVVASIGDAATGEHGSDVCSDAVCVPRSSFPAHFLGHGAVPALRAPLAAPCSCSTRNSPDARPARHFFVHHMQCEHPWCCTMLPASAPPGTAKQSCAALTEHPALCPARAAHAKACKTLKAWKTGGKSRNHQCFRLCCSVWLHASLRKGDPPLPGGSHTEGGNGSALRRRAGISPLLESGSSREILIS